MSIQVPDSGAALVASKVVTYEAESCEIQLVLLADGTTPSYNAGVTSRSHLKVDQEAPDSYTSYLVGVTAGADIIVPANSNRKKVTVQNFTDGATNSTIYIGWSTVSTSTGIALLDGSSREFTNKGALYGIVASGTVYLRVLEEINT